MDKDKNLNVKCTSCGMKMKNRDFDVHECPNHVEPIEGESFEEYCKRAEELKTKN